MLRANGIQSRDVPSSYFLTWHSIASGKKENFSYFDEGGYSEIDPGLAHHKRGLGGEIVTHLPLYYVCDSRVKRLLGLSADWMRTRLLKWSYPAKKWFKNTFKKSV